MVEIIWYLWLCSVLGLRVIQCTGFKLPYDSQKAIATKHIITTHCKPIHSKLHWHSKLINFPQHAQRDVFGTISTGCNFYVLVGQVFEDTQQKRQERRSLMTFLQLHGIIICDWLTGAKTKNSCYHFVGDILHFVAYSGQQNYSPQALG